MGIVTLAVCGIAAWRLYEHGTLFVVAVIVAIANFWSLGVMHNYAGESTSQSPQQRTAISVNMLTALLGLILLASSFL